MTEGGEMAFAVAESAWRQRVSITAFLRSEAESLRQSEPDAANIVAALAARVSNREDARHTFDAPPNPLSLIAKALGVMDHAADDCPVRKGGRFMEKCARCGAGTSDGCPLDIDGAYSAISRIRQILAEHGEGE